MVCLMENEHVSVIRRFQQAEKFAARNNFKLTITDCNRFSLSHTHYDVNDIRLATIEEIYVWIGAFNIGMSIGTWKLYTKRKESGLHE